MWDRTLGWLDRMLNDKGQRVRLKQSSRDSDSRELLLYAYFGPIEVRSWGQHPASINVASPPLNVHE